MTNKQMQAEILHVARIQYGHLDVDIDEGLPYISVEDRQGKTVFFDQGDGALEMIEQANKASDKFAVDPEDWVLFYLDSAGALENVKISGDNNERKMILRTGIEVPIKKSFSYLGEIFTVHHPWYRYMSEEAVTINEKYWTVSHYETGAALLSSTDWQKTIQGTIERAKMILDETGYKRMKTAIKGIKKINPLFPSTRR